MSSIERINPDRMHKNPAFSQAIITSGNGKTIYIGGQNAVNKDGDIVGKNDLAQQTVQVLTNMSILLEECKADFSDIVKMTIYFVQGQDISSGFKAAQGFLGNRYSPSTVSAMMVSGLANPDFLIEIDAIAFIPE